MTPDMKRLCEAVRSADGLPAPLGLDDAAAERVVRAVLSALREPSEGMKHAARLRLYRYKHNDEPDALDTNPLAFASAIDHILAAPATT